MIKNLAMVGVTVVALTFASEAFAQVDVFGYPAGGGSCGAGGCADGAIAMQQRSFGYGQVSDRFRATQAQNEKIYARNEAWPKPFSCASRQLYHNIWRPMYDAGWEDQCILTSTHFDENGELTRYGKQQIGGMMMNMPKARRVVYVQDTSDSASTQARVSKVESVIETWYSNRGGVVQVSSRMPAEMPGWRAVDIVEKATSNAPIPVIPIADGQSGITQAVGQ